MTDQVAQIRSLQAENEALRDSLYVLQQKLDAQNPDMEERSPLADAVDRIESIRQQHQSLTRFLDTVLDLSPYALWVADASGTVIRTNRALRDALNLKDPQIVGQYNVLNDQNMELQGVAGEVRAVFESHAPARFRIPWQVAHVDGVDFSGAQDLFIDVSMFPIVKGGELTNVVCQWVDITELMQMEQRLLKAKEGAVAASRAKSEFLANMSHELRTPLTPIMGFSDLLLLDNNLTDDQRQLLNIIHQRSQDLLQLLNDILDIAKIEANQMAVRPDEVDVKKLTRDVIAMFEHEMEPEVCTIRTRFGGALHDALWLDPVRLRQILLNLIGNAVKHAKASVIEVELDVLPSGADGDEELRVLVRDDGCGIPEEYQELIFESFQQIDGSTTRDSPGVGLGLAICKRLAQLMGGDIKLTSESGQGAEFAVTFRLPKRDSTARPVPTKGTKRIPNGNIRVLLVEDDRPSATFTRLTLNRMGYQCHWVNNGLEAVAACQRKTFDLILMDVSMPVMDGLEATRIIRKNMSGDSRMPIVALTAHAFQEDRDHCLQSGMDDWISKPISVEKLKSIDRYLCA